MTTIARIMVKDTNAQGVRNVSTALNSLTGVDSASFGPASNQITVYYNNELVRLTQLRKTVEAGGLDVLSEWNES